MHLPQKENDVILLSSASILLDPAKVVRSRTNDKPCIFGRNLKAIICQNCLQYPYDLKNPNARLVHWMLALKDFNSKVKCRTEGENTLELMHPAFSQTTQYILQKYSTLSNIWQKKKKMSTITVGMSYQTEPCGDVSNKWQYLLANKKTSWNKQFLTCRME